MPNILLFMLKMNIVALLWFIIHWRSWTFYFVSLLGWMFVCLLGWMLACLFVSFEYEISWRCWINQKTHFTFHMPTRHGYKYISDTLDLKTRPIFIVFYALTSIPYFDSSSVTPLVLLHESALKLLDRNIRHLL